MVGVRRSRGPDTRLQRSWPVSDMSLKTRDSLQDVTREQGGEGTEKQPARHINRMKEKELRERLVLLNGGTSDSGVRSPRSSTFPQPSGSIANLAHSPLVLPGSAAPGQSW